MFGGTTSTGGSLWGNIEGDISSIFGSLTNAANQNINQTLNPSPSFSSSSVLLIAGVAIVAILLLR